MKYFIILLTFFIIGCSSNSEYSETPEKNVVFSKFAVMPDLVVYEFSYDGKIFLVSSKGGIIEVKR